jgi:hypothetical protein
MNMSITNLGLKGVDEAKKKKHATGSASSLNLSSFRVGKPRKPAQHEPDVHNLYIEPT